MALELGTRLGPYEVLGPLGAGGMGEVLRARDTKLWREVALKTLPEAFSGNPERVASFQREARALATLNHPGIASIYGLEEESGIRFLVLELVPGKTLAERLLRGALPMGEALALCAQVAEALAAAHEHGLIHRDLKPANINVTPEGRTKLLDFGLARFCATQGGGPHSEESPTLTTPTTDSGGIHGTPAYMSPEQARGEELDRRCDIWAFGCVLYETLTGRRAFPGETVSDTIAAVLEHEPEWDRLPAETPDGVRALLRRCLRKDRPRRLHDVADAGIELQDACDPGTQTEASAHRGSRAVPWAAGFLSLALGFALWTPWRQASSTSIQRFAVRLRPDVSLGTEALNRGAAAVLSPSGDRLAFVGQEGEGPSRIYIRRLDRLEASPLSGTEGATSPFFSPDGKWIAFFAADELQKVSLSGGAAITLCDAPSERGGTWGPDGTILFTPSSAVGVGLSRVSAAGGACQPATKPDPGAGEGTHRWPQWLPGGDAVLYTAHNNLSSYEDANLVVETIPGGRRKVVYRGGYFGRYLPSGHLLFIHEGTLFAAPFDLGMLETSGAAIPALEGLRVTPDRAGAQFAFSKDGTLVYVAGGTSALSAPIHWLSRDGTTTLLRAEPANWASPRFSPTGDRLSMMIHDGTQWDVAVYDLTRNTLSRVTFHAAPDHLPLWTPDGRHITFSSERSSGRSNIYWRRSDGSSEVQRLTWSDYTQNPVSWHPDGSVLLFVENRPDTGWDLMALKVEGDEGNATNPGAPSVLLTTPFNETYATFSPDGRWLAYESDESGRVEVYVRPFPGPAGKWLVSTGGGYNPQWSRARSELVYGTPDSKIMVLPYTLEGGSFHPGKPRLWSHSTFVPRPWQSLRSFDLHPDGQRVALQSAFEPHPARAPDTVIFVTNFFDELGTRFREAESSQ